MRFHSPFYYFFCLSMIYAFTHYYLLFLIYWVDFHINPFSCNLHQYLL